MSLSIVKELVYVALDQQESEEDGKKGMGIMEAQLNVMQGVFLMRTISVSTPPNASIC